MKEVLRTGKHKSTGARVRLVKAMGYYWLEEKQGKRYSQVFTGSMNWDNVNDIFDRNVNAEWTACDVS